MQVASSNASCFGSYGPLTYPRQGTPTEIIIMDSVVVVVVNGFPFCSWSYGVLYSFNLFFNPIIPFMIFLCLIIFGLSGRSFLPAIICMKEKAVSERNKKLINEKDQLLGELESQLLCVTFVLLERSINHG